MKYLLEMSRIIDGAINGNKTKVIAYTEQLARKLHDSGDQASATRLKKIINGNHQPELSTANALDRRLPVDNESRLSLADESLDQLDEVQIILNPSLRTKVDEFIRYINAADRLLANKVGIVPSMLIYGPPGVGKTELARYISAKLELPLITGRLDSLISSFLGSTAKNLRSLFEHAKNRPCVLFLDEIDAVAKLRDDQYELGELKRVVVSLLQNIDALDNQTILVAATNHAHLLDPAVWRRFAYKIEMPMPDIESRKQLFELFLNEFTPSPKDTQLFTELSENTSGADIRHICEDAIRAMVISELNQIDILHVIRNIINIRLGGKADFSSTDRSCLQSMISLHPNITRRLLASLFDVSESTISRRLAERSKNNAKQQKTAN